jgi:hypothetical protein
VSADELPEVQNPDVHGIVLPKRLLAAQVALMFEANYMLGLRLRQSIAELDPGKLPSMEWRDAYRVYQAATRGLMAEQRWRAKMAAKGAAAGGALLSDEEYEAELRATAREAIMEMPDSDLNELLLAREAASTMLTAGEEDL